MKHVKLHTFSYVAMDTETRPKGLLDPKIRDEKIRNYVSTINNERMVDACSKTL